MAFKLAVDNSKLDGMDVLPQGIYRVRMMGFKPKFSKLKDGQTGPTSLNYNAQMQVIGRPDLEEKGPRFVYEGLNENAGWVMQDFCHAFGLPMETDGAASWFPGEWDGEEGKAETYKYRGPLVGQEAEIELGIDSYLGKENNKVSRYLCRVAQCAQKFPKINHSANLLKKK